MTDETITVTPSCGCVFADLDIPCRQKPAPCPVCVKRGNLHPANRPENLLRRVDRARDTPGVTCSASRHVQAIGEVLIRGRKYAMLNDEPEHVGVSLLSVVESLYKARAEIDRLRAKLGVGDD